MSGTNRNARLKKVGAAALVVCAAGLLFSPAANAGMNHWFKKLYWALGGMVNAIYDLRDDVQGLEFRLEELEADAGSGGIDPDLPLRVDDNSAAIAVLEQDVSGLAGRIDALDRTSPSCCSRWRAPDWSPRSAATVAVTGWPGEPTGSRCSTSSRSFSW